MVSIVCLDLLADALGQAPGSVGHVFLVVGMTAVGFGLIYLLNLLVDKKTNPQVKHIDKQHPKTADQLSELIHSDHYEEHKKEYAQTKEQKSRRQLFIAGLVMAFAIALHNFPEGMVIGASYASDETTGGVGGLATAIVIGLHNIPEGMAVSVPLAAGGMGKVKATVLTALTGAPTILGAMLGVLPRYAQPRHARAVAQFCERRDALCRVRRTVARIHSDVALEGARTVAAEGEGGAKAQNTGAGENSRPAFYAKI